MNLYSCPKDKHPGNEIQSLTEWLTRRLKIAPTILLLAALLCAPAVGSARFVRMGRELRLFTPVLFMSPLS